MNRFLDSLRILGLVALVVGAAASLASKARAADAAVPAPLSVNWYHGAEFLQPVMAAFTAETGIPVQVTSAYDRFDTDVVLVSDYKGLTEGKKFRHFMKLDSAVVDKLVPARWRDRDGYWTGVLLRARAPIFDRARVASADLPRDWFGLAEPRWRGQLTLRGGNNVYNRSLVAWMIHHHGEARVQEWARALVANRVAPPRWLGDTPNAAAIAKGGPSIGFINTYYLGYMRSGHPDWGDDPKLPDRLGIAWLDQAPGGIGQHVNVTGAAINLRTEREPEARRLVEWLVSDKGQQLLSQHVFKYPVRPDVAPSPYLRSLGGFRVDTTDLNDLELLYDIADRVMRQAGWTQTW